MLQLDQGKKKEEEVELSDEDFIQDHFIAMHCDTLVENSNPGLKKKATRMLQKQSSMDWEYRDIITMLDWNEKRHQEVAKEYLKETSVMSLKNVQVEKTPLKLISEFTKLAKITNNLISLRQFQNAKATCCAISDELTLIGTSEGNVLMYDLETEEEYHVFSEKNKEFLGNAVTAIDVHTTRTDYVVLGFEKGQLVLFDVTEPKKSLKVLKENHKGVPIVNIKFCDWQGKKAIEDHEVPQSGSVIDDKHIWMFISLDEDGKMIINTIKKVLFTYNASKHIIIDPSKINTPIFYSIAPRFDDPMYQC